MASISPSTEAVRGHVSPAEAEVRYVDASQTTSSQYVLVDTQTGRVCPMPSLSNTLPARNVEQAFRALADEWISETQYDSSPIDKFMHPAHFKIIGMGEPVVPLILREVQKMSGHWFLALRSITRQDPVSPEESNSVERTAEAWLRWGKREGKI